ncbi:transposase [Nonomuraea sp. G32]|nr:transposase [Nonomuraea sp. G32]MDP4510629.1 transposase [Nonomuraea sp. G32]
MCELRAYATEALPDQPEPTPVIGIDEIRRGRPRWEQDPDTGKYRLAADRWHVGFTDLATGQGLLGQVEGSVSTSVAAWLNARPEAWRTAVTHVAIDMCQTFRCAVRAALPHTITVVDHFHRVQLANGKLADLRRRLTWKMRDRRGRTGDPEYDHWRQLRSNLEDLTDEQIAILERDLSRSPRPSPPGGTRSRRSCSPGSPTPRARAPTASSSSKPAAHTASATRPTNASGHGAQPHEGAETVPFPLN